MQDYESTSIKQQQESASIESLAKTLELSKCQLITVPREIIKFTVLQELRLSYNHMANIPECLFMIPTLKILHLDHNVINNLPQQLTGWSNLEEIKLNCNLIKNVPPSISQLTQVKKINLSKNSIQEIPPEISLLRKLELLNISHNKLKELPETMANISRLQYLNVSSNKLTRFPIDGSWRSLKKLKISSNFITSTNPLSLCEFAKKNKVFIDIPLLPSNDNIEMVNNNNHSSDNLTPILDKKSKGKFMMFDDYSKSEHSRSNSNSNVPLLETKFKKNRREQLQKSGSFSFGSIPDVKAVGNPFKAFQRRNSGTKFVEIDGNSNSPKEKTVFSPFSPRRRGRNRKRSLSSDNNRSNTNSPTMLRNRSKSAAFSDSFGSKDRKSKRKRLMKSIQKKEEKNTYPKAPTATLSPHVEFTTKNELASGTLEDMLELLLFDSQLGKFHSNSLKVCTKNKRNLIFWVKIENIEKFQKEFALVYPSLIDDREFIEFLFYEFGKGCYTVKYR